MSKFLIEVLELVTNDEDGQELLRRNQYWRRIGQIDQYLRLNIVLRFNDVSSWRMRCVAGTDQSKLMKPGRKMLIWYEGMSQPLLSGPVTQIERYWDDSNKGVGSVDFIGECDNRVWDNHLWLPTSDHPGGETNYQGRFSKDYDQQTSYSFSRLLAVSAAYQFGPLSEISTLGTQFTGGNGNTYRRASNAEGFRTLPGYELATTTEPGTPEGGPTRDEWPRASFRVRFDNLLDVLKEKAATSVDESDSLVPVGFRMVWNAETGQIKPMMYFPNPQEQARRNLFSVEMGNLRRYQYTIKEPGANRAFFAFDGEGANRNIHYMSADHYDLSTGQGQSWPLGEWQAWKEEFLDRRDQKVPANVEPDERAEAEAQIEQAKAEFYEASRPKAAISMEVMDTEHFRFGRDYFVGDYVQIDMDGELLTDIMREVSLVEESGSFTITPTVGSGDASETPELYKQVRRIWRRLETIGTRFNG